MKKFLTMVVALILLLSMSSCSLIVEKKEAEYKAKIKQELDSIPLEETGYKLVEVPEGDPETFPEYNYFNIDEHSYHFYYSNYKNNGVFSLTVDEQSWEDRKSTNDLSKYGVFFKNYNYNELYGCTFFDNQIFLVIYQKSSALFSIYDVYLPPILFLYNYEENTIKYCGYFEEWFNYRPGYAFSKYFKIVKL